MIDTLKKQALENVGTYYINTLPTQDKYKETWTEVAEAHLRHVLQKVMQENSRLRAEIEQLRRDIDSNPTQLIKPEDIDTINSNAVGITADDLLNACDKVIDSHASANKDFPIDAKD